MGFDEGVLQSDMLRFPSIPHWSPPVLTTTLRCPLNPGKSTPVALRIIREAANTYLQQSAEHRESLVEHEDLERFFAREDRRSFQRGVSGWLSGFSISTAARWYRNLSGRDYRSPTVYPRSVVKAALRRGAAASANLRWSRIEPEGLVLDPIFLKALEP
jgi:hypothetical protein